ncbi:MAG TPA: hypothetical protein VHA52_02240 [Candidatus Babeliaceae bacterium]|nr:hypothetical protein [Candidatus Babeliaceae bacterium]
MIILLTVITALSEQEYLNYKAELKEQNITIVHVLPVIEEEEFIDFNYEQENQT